MEEALKLISLKDLSFFALAVIIGYASYKGTWVWGSQMKEKVEDLEEQLREAKEDARIWKATALQSLGVADTVASIANTLRPK